MKNMMKDFNQFVQVNEGNWFKRKFNSKYFDANVKELLSQIKSEFDINKLGEIVEMREYDDHSFTYNHRGINIQVYYDHILIDDEDITKYVDVHYIKELYKFFNTKNQNKEKIHYNNRIRDFKQKIDNKFSILMDEEDEDYSDQ